jgi:hypothetical protein
MANPDGFPFLLCVGYFFLLYSLYYSFFFHAIDTSDLLHRSLAQHFKTFKVSDLLSEVSKFQHRTKLCSKCFFLKYKSHLLVKSVFSLLNGTFAKTILDLISFVHLASFVIMLPK